MAEKKSAIAQLREKRAKEAKEYKTTHDVERVHHLIGALTQLRDQTGAAAVAASFARELSALNLKQQELDEKDKEEQNKEVAEAYAADQKAAEPEEPKSRGASRETPTQAQSR